MTLRSIKLGNVCLKIPSITEEWKAIASDFEEKWQFRNVIGAIDGKYVIIPPLNSESN